MNSIKASDSVIEMREMVLPNDTNLLGNLLGGRLLHLIDIAGAMVAQRFSSHIVATVSIDNVDFKYPSRVGNIVTLKAKLTWAGRTSMEVIVNVYTEDFLTGETKFTNKAYLTFVAVDTSGKPTAVPKLLVETEEEKKEFALAEKRHEDRLKRKMESS
jgi:acyl-CoA hydrolase